MFEQLISLHPAAVMPVFPESGPGPSRLQYGDENAGYFGEVNSSELFTSSEVAYAGPLIGGVTANDGNAVPLWFKFIFKGKILFIARKPVRNSVIWNQLYAAGLVYGTNDLGVSTGYTNGTTPLPRVNQKRVITRKDSGGNVFNFAVRLMTSMSEDPTANWLNQASSGPSEFGTLYEAMLPTVGHPLKWKTYGATDMQWGSVVGKETWTAAPEYNLILGGNTSYLTRDRMLKTGLAGWRPVLELLPNDTDVVIPDTAAPGQVEFITPGNFTWVVPAGVNSVSFVMVGAGQTGGASGGDSGGLRYRNSIPVTPGATYNIKVGSGQGANDAATDTRVTAAFGTWVGIKAEGSTFTDKVKGGYGSVETVNFHNNGGNAGTYTNGTNPTTRNTNAGTFIGGMGTSLYGPGNTAPNASVGGTPGGGGGYMAKGGNGAVRIIWGDGRSFPDNAVNV